MLTCKVAYLISPTVVIKAFQALHISQASLTLSSRQRYFLKQCKEEKTSIYLKGVPKAMLLGRDMCMEYLKTLVSPGMSVCLS